MTLKEKFEECLWAFDKSIIKNQSEKCDVIADEFAIGFLDFAKNETDYDAWDSKFDYKDILYNSKELLEIYKKEQGL